MSQHEDCYGTFKKLVRNSEYSISDDFKKLSVLAQILRFLQRENTCILYQCDTNTWKWICQNKPFYALTPL